MPRARLLKPGYFTNDALNALPFPARHLFAGLWVIADREGRLEDRPMRIRAEVFPYDRVNVSKLLDSLEHAGFIARYQADSKPYIQVVNFLKHQTPNVREAPSAIPPPPCTVLSTIQSTALHDPSTPVAVAVVEAVAVPVAVAVPRKRGKRRTAPAAAAEPTGNEGLDYLLRSLAKTKVDEDLRAELAELADEYSLAALEEGVAGCRHAGKLPFPSYLRKHLPTLNEWDRRAGPERYS